MPFKRSALVLIFGLCWAVPLAAQPAGDSGRSGPLAEVCAKVLCRKPGHVVPLRMADGKVFEATTEGYPYLDEDGGVFIYPGETIAITLEKKGGRLDPQLASVTGLDGAVNLAVKPASTRTVSFAFKQDPKIGMVLTATNATNLAIKYDARMFVPGPEGVKPHPTTMCPLLPPQGTAQTYSGVEDWPHPIVMLVLRNIRIQPDGAPRTCN